MVAKLLCWMLSVGTVDRGLAGLGIAMALGSATFATDRILHERPAHPSFGPPRALDTRVELTTKGGETPADNSDDRRTGSLPDPAHGAEIPRPHQAEPRAKDLRDATDRPARSRSSYVVRYADVDVALLQSADGTRVVTPGAVVPDAGLIRSIEKRAGRWVVVTASGMIEEPPM